MRSVWIAVLVVSASAANAADIVSVSAIERVTVYPDGASVVRTINVDVPAGDNVVVAPDFPLLLDPSSLRVEGEAPVQLAVGAVEAKPPRPEEPPKLDNARIEELQDEIGHQDDIIAAANLRLKLASSIVEGRVPPPAKDGVSPRPLAELQPAFGMVQDEALLAARDVRGAAEKKRELERQIAALKRRATAAPPSKTELRINVAAAQAGKATFRVTYTVRAAKWSALYDARLTSPGPGNATGSVDIVRRAEIEQHSGEDWADVPLSVSTLRSAGGTSAAELDPLIVRYRPPQFEQARMTEMAPASRSAVGGASPEAKKDSDMASPAAPSVPMQETEAAVDSGGYQVVYRIAGKSSVLSGESAKNFRLSSSTVVPELVIKSTPALDASAFIEASFKQVEEAPLLPGRTLIYRDGIYVGQGRMPLTPKDEKVRIGFGIDEKVKVERIAVRKNMTTPSGVAGYLAKSKTEEREYAFKVHNGHDIAAVVRIEDRLPVSENDEVKIEMLPGSAPPTEQDVRDRRGIQAWTLAMKPNSDQSLSFGWRVSWPKEKDLVID
jgi:uncharacterized protein (TIGR02231 family)